MPRQRILTWHVHGNYLAYLANIDHDIFLPVRRDGTPGYSGRPAGFGPLPNVHNVPAEQVKDLELDCIVFQSHRNYLEDQYEILTAEQRHLPRILIEHDPPREHPTDTRHPVDDPQALIVHCTPFNNLMWDSGRTPTAVIDHGVAVPDDVRYTGELARGIVVVNNLAGRGRRLGRDVFERARREVPLDLVGLGAAELGGLGEVPHAELPAFIARYRFFFNPIRYTSLGLAVCEAMSVGLPVVGLATTELVTVVQNGVSGYVETDVEKLIHRLQLLLRDRDHAQSLGEAARRYARARFDIRRFAADWDRAIERANALVSRETASATGAVGSPGARR